MTEITKDWCLNMARAAEAAGDPEIGAGTLMAERTFDDGITFAIEQLATILGVESWSIQDGSDDHSTDVRDTIRHVLDQSHYAPRDSERLLREARQYVADAGSDEDPETQEKSSALLAEIDDCLIPATEG